MGQRYYYEVIVVRCTPDRKAVYGDRVVTWKCPDARLALSNAINEAATGVCVIIRPNFNERDVDGSVYFREWRCFNNGPFVECKWPLGEPSARTLTGDNIELPEIPNKSVETWPL